MSQTNNGFALMTLSQRLLDVARRVPTPEIGDTTAVILQAISETNDPIALAYLTQGLSALKRLTPEAAGEAAAALAQSMTKITEGQILDREALALAAIAPCLDAKGAAAAGAKVVQAMAKTKEPHALRALAIGLSALLGRLEPDEAARQSAAAAAALTQVLAQAGHPNDIEPLARGLTAVAAHLNAQDAAAAAATLTQTMNRITELSALPPLVEALSAVAQRLEPGETAHLTAVAADKLVQAMTKANDPYTLPHLAEGWSALAARLEAKEAAAAAVTVMHAITVTRDPNSLRSLVNILSAVLHREPVKRRLQRIYSAPRVVGLTASWMVLAPTTALAEAAQQPPEPLPAETLVELLKHPLCVGEARRAVLDALGTRYQRHFADQWEFVRFAEEQKLGLDFTSPPRPQPLADKKP
jgi:hypothetical protein